MIQEFIKFLSDNDVPYRFLNGYEELFKKENNTNDNDILLKKQDFLRVNNLIEGFCSEKNYLIVQIYFQEALAKNFFLYNPNSNQILNLDLYGEVVRNGVLVLNESDVFIMDKKYKNFSILNSEHEFFQYLIKKILKGKISINEFHRLAKLFDDKRELCIGQIENFFPISKESIIRIFSNRNYDDFVLDITKFKKEFGLYKNKSSSKIFSNGFRILNRIFKPTGIEVSFLGPDGSGKSTIIDGLLQTDLPFRRTDYFHLKPIPIKEKGSNTVVAEPHKYRPYSMIKSIIKLMFFIYQYCYNWIKNIIVLKRKSSLIIYDRYFDDMIVDYKRYRYGGPKFLVKKFRCLIPRPDIYFVLTGDPEVIYNRKQEVDFPELKRQIQGYKELCDGKRYIEIDVNREPADIVSDVRNVLIHKLNERY